MTATFRPQTHEHLVTAASALVAYLLRSDRDTRVVGYVEELALQPARDMLAALDAHRYAEGAVRSAFITYSEADDAADDALRQHFGHPKLNNKAAYDRLLTLTNGMTMNDYVRMTGPAQVSAVRDHLSRLSGAGHIPGTHTIGFDGPSETVTLTHTVRDRGVFAHGALEAARWLVGRRGWFTMRDVLTTTTSSTGV